MTATAATSVAAPPRRVWHALLDPTFVPRFIPVRSVATDWHVGSPIVWTSDFTHGRPRDVVGTVVRVEPERVLAYDYVNPFTKSTLSVTIELSREGDGTHIAVAETGHRTEVERAHGEGGWRLALANLRAALE
jgi:uncharacterized protein YndB with AHSA1/START domain